MQNIVVLVYFVIFQSISAFKFNLFDKMWILLTENVTSSTMRNQKWKSIEAGPGAPAGPCAPAGPWVMVEFDHVLCP